MKLSEIVSEKVENKTNPLQYSIKKFTPYKQNSTEFKLNFPDAITSFTHLWQVNTLGPVVDVYELDWE